MKSLKIYLIVIALFSLGSCTKNFDELRRNPNAVVSPDPSLVFTNSVRGAINFFGGEFNKNVMFNYTQHFAGFQGRFQRYSSDITPLNNYWNNCYVNALKPANDIIVLYDGVKGYENRVNIAKIWKCYILSQITAIWGPVPYESGLRGNLVTPYNREQDIYYMLLNDLKVCSESINANGDYFSTDLIFGKKVSDNQPKASDVVKWQKFANTLRLRLAMRISNPAPNGDPAKAMEVVEEVFAAEALTISANDETACAKWGGIMGGDNSDINPLYMYAVYNKKANVGTLPVFCETANYHMAPYGDPRIEIYADTVSANTISGAVPLHRGEYFGDTASYGGSGGNSGLTPSSDVHKAMTREDYSPIGKRFTAADAEFIFLSYAECCFLKAEAKLKGWGSASSKSAEDYYNEGIKASMTRYEIASAKIDTYLATPGIKWGTATKTTDEQGNDISEKFMDWLKICNSIVAANDFSHQIVMQHWLAIPNQGVDAWTLLRRTQELQFEPSFTPYEGNYKYLPYRLEYPTNEFTYNGIEVNKAVNNYLAPRGMFSGNNMYVKLWWSLPLKPIAAIPNPTDFL